MHLYIFVYADDAIVGVQFFDVKRRLNVVTIAVCAAI